mmetsp:Transcript_15148/g.36978  ORF Transcript_15148/g.36978 Transcript_15148/m.36978 type:complete len:438 (-) Transcript_15148:12-1325(-)
MGVDDALKDLPVTEQRHLERLRAPREHLIDDAADEVVEKCVPLVLEEEVEDRRQHAQLHHPRVDRGVLKPHQLLHHLENLEPVAAEGGVQRPSRVCDGRHGGGLPQDHHQPVEAPGQLGDDRLGFAGRARAVGAVPHELHEHGEAVLERGGCAVERAIEEGRDRRGREEVRREARLVRGERGRLPVQRLRPAAHEAHERDRRVGVHLAVEVLAELADELLDEADLVEPLELEHGGHALLHLGYHLEEELEDGEGVEVPQELRHDPFALDDAERLLGPAREEGGHDLAEVASEQGVERRLQFEEREELVDQLIVREKAVIHRVQVRGQHLARLVWVNELVLVLAVGRLLHDDVLDESLDLLRNRQVVYQLLVELLALLDDVLLLQQLLEGEVPPLQERVHGGGVAVAKPPEHPSPPPPGPHAIPPLPPRGTTLPIGSP